MAMAQTLTLSPKLSPFPFAALAIAAYTQKTDIVFDDAATEAVLELNGSKISSQEDIIRALATDCASAEDTPAVRGFARSANRKMLNC
jgi:glutamyl-tRNA synthetase